MNLQGRSLTQGLTGADVAELQSELARLNFTIPAAEQQASSFGAGTLTAVRQFQSSSGLTVNGIVDAVTAGALTSRLADSLYTVTGTVTSVTRAGVGALATRLIDKNVGGDQVLATGRLNPDGSYAFSQLAVTPEYLKAHHKTSPDLQVTLSAGDTQIGASAVSYNAPMTVTLDIVLPDSAAGLPSEFETLTAALRTTYVGNFADLQEGAERQDITYLANKVGWDARAVAIAALAHQFSALAPVAASPTPVTPTAPTRTVPAPTVPQPTVPTPASTSGGPPSTVPAPANPVPANPPPAAAGGLQPEFYYALFRAGIPANAEALFRTGPGTAQAVWKQAIAQGVIPEALTAQIPAALKTFQTLSATHALTAVPLVGLSTLQAMLTPTLPSLAQQQQFAAIYSQHRDNLNAFWPAITQAMGAQTAKQLQFMGQLYYLTANNAPIVTALTAAEARAPLSSILDLATRGYYDAAQWTKLIGTAIPPGIPGANADEQRSNYAQLLAAQVRIAHPTAVLADQVRRGIVPLTDTAATRHVADFLTAHQERFEIGVEPVEAYIARNKVTGTPAEVVGHIKRIQRVYQLTADDTSLSTLLQHNLDSAFAITRYDSEGFVRTFGHKLGGAKKAKEVHARSKQVFGAVLNIATSYANARLSPAFGGSSPTHLGFPPPTTPSYPVIAYPTLEDLFGSLDYCTCSDCNSILSPAAYFVDLLHYLDQPAPSPDFMNPQEALLQRRPDLQYLPLTCANTNTALPYIDVVNETLEYYVANNLSLANFEGYDTDGSVTSAELIATPQNVNDAAYVKLQNAFFPPPLPFNRPLNMLRQQLQALNVVLPDAMAALRTSDKVVDRTTPTSYGWSDILMEQLGISRDEYRLFTDPTVQLGDLYGLPNASAATTLAISNLQEFSRRTGVSYVDLTAIVETQFINPNAVLLPRLQRLNAPFATIKTLHDNLSTPQSIATEFIAALPAGLDATQYGGAVPTDYQAVVDWVTDPKIYPRIMDLITIANPAGAPDDCSGASLQFRYSNPSVAKDLLTGTDFLKLIRFIRLWRKLTPLLAGDHPTTIAQTDAILAALYPAADLPVSSNDPANDPANLTRLNQGFQTLLLRAGVLFQVMNRLSLSAKAALAQLLACWAPIGTVGPNALYQRMFLTPTLAQQDSGAQTATVANAVNVGDVLTTTINNGTGIPPHTVAAGETATTVAAAIAASINGASAPDPVSGLPLNTRFFASSQGGVITLKAGFTLSCSVSTGATASYTAAAGSPLSHAATVAGTLTPGNVLATTIDGLAIPYTVASIDTPATIAANIAAAINATTAPDPYSGLPLNDLAVASSAGATVTVVAANAGAPFILACALVPAMTGSYVAGPPVAAARTGTISGTVHTGDTLVTTINGQDIAYTAVAVDTTATALAASIAATINTTVEQDPTTLLPLSSVVHARAAGNVVTVNPRDPMTLFTLACRTTAGSETYVAAGPFPASQTATIAGTIAAGAVLTTTVNDLDLYYTAVTGDTPAAIATKIALLINNTATPDLVTGLALNTVVSAAAAGGAITVTAASPTASFTLAVALSAASYTAGRKLPPFADNGYGDFLADASQTLYGHEPLLCAAFNLTGAEFTLITGALGLDATTPLTLGNVSAVFRYGWLAHTLGLSVLEFLRFRQFTGLDPFATLDLAATPPTEPPIIGFVALLQAMSAAGLRSVQALYLLWNQDISGKSAPPASDLTGLAFALRGAFAAVDTQFALQDDPDGSIAQGLMTLVYGTSASDFFFGLLNGTFATSVAYGNPAGQAALPQGIIDASGGRLRYDDLSKQISFAGVLDAAAQSALTSALTVNTTDHTDNVAAGGAASFTPTAMTNIEPGSVLVIDTGGAQEVVAVTATTVTDFTATTQKPHSGTATAFAIVNDPTLPAGIAALAVANQQTVGAFFAVYPELQPLYAAYFGSTDPAATRRTALLNNFLPTLKQKRKEEQALASVTAAAGSDPSFATALLQDPSVLHADADPTSPAIADFTAIQNGGLAVQWFQGNDPSAPPDLSIDSVALLSYRQTATVGGSIAANNVLTTTINGFAVPYTVSDADTSLSLLAGHIAAAINATTTLDPASNLPLNQVVSASADGAVVVIGGVAPSGANGVFTLACATSAGATTTYAAGTQLPPGTGGGPVAGIWSGYITAPQDGLYNFAVAADAGTGITLQIGGATVAGAQTADVWRNQSPVSLVAGALVPIVLTAMSLKTTLSVSWQSLGLGWQIIPASYLYSRTLIARLDDTYIRFLKAASLADALSLTAAEIAILGTAAGFAVNTTGTTTTAAGNAVFTPSSMANIGVGSVLVIDRGTTQESVTVSATTPTTFSAVAAHAHSGSTAPFAIVDAAAPDLGRGWLNFLAVAQDPDAAIASRLRAVLGSLLDFTRIKTALSPDDDRVLAILQNPSAAPLLSLTGWAQVSVNTLLTQFFGDSSYGHLSSIENFARVFDAYAIVQTCRVNASALIAAVTNAPLATTVSTLQSALRAQYAEADWLTAIQPINDAMRTSQRDALVAYILQQIGDQYAQAALNRTTSAAAATGAKQLTLSDVGGIQAGMLVAGLDVGPGAIVVTLGGNIVTLNIGILGSLPAGSGLSFIPKDAVQMNTPDKLYEYFLIDPENQPAVQTSRIQLAMSSVQLFIERIVRNLEPQVSPSDVDATQWQWMKRYRVWQANREVFLWPENWLYPELRDNQSSFFQDMMGSLLQSDITDDAAANAYLDYLTNLEEVAKLEPCGLYYQPGTADTDETSYVVARTAGARRKYYFRQLQYGAWTPWSEVKIDCEDMPLTPIVWDGRLFLFWLKITKQAAPKSQNAAAKANQNLKTKSVSALGMDDLQTFGTQAVSAQASVDVSAVLCWSEYYNGKWQPTKTSDANNPAWIGSFDQTGPNSFDVDRNRVRIEPGQYDPKNPKAKGATFVLPDGALILQIVVPSTASAPVNGFVLYNTHSLPVRLEDISFPTNMGPDILGHLLAEPNPRRKLTPSRPYSGGYSSSTSFTIDYYNKPTGKSAYSRDVLGFDWGPHFVEPQFYLPDAWDAPFFYEDRRYLFYVTTAENFVPAWRYGGFGLNFTAADPPIYTSWIPPLAYPKTPLRPGDPVEDFVAKPIDIGDQTGIQRYLNQETNIRVGLGTGDVVSYQGRAIAPTGSVAIITTPQE